MHTAALDEQAPRRRWWLAFLLNAFAPPTGYVYAGSLRAAVLTVVLAPAAVLAALGLTILFPPGVYSRLFGLGYEASLSTLQLAAAALLAAHAAWISRCFKPPLGRRLAWSAALASLAALLAAAWVLKSAAPVSVFRQASASMEPSVFEGDVVAVRGGRSHCGRVRPVVGEQVLFRRPERLGIHWMHRVVAGPGSVVEMRRGQLLVDGRAALVTPVPNRPKLGSAEAALTAKQALETLPGGPSHTIQDLGVEGVVDTTPPTRLGPESWFVLGDNRDNAVDSRTEGPVETRDVCGVAFKVLQSAETSRVGERP